MGSQVSSNAMWASHIYAEVRQLSLIEVTFLAATWNTYYVLRVLIRDFIASITV